MTETSEHIIVKIINPIIDQEILNELIYKDEIKKIMPFYDIIKIIVLRLDDLHISLHQKKFYKLMFNDNIVFDINEIFVDHFDDFNINKINELIFNIIYIPNMINDLIDLLISNISNTIRLNELICDLITLFGNRFSSYFQIFEFKKDQIPLKYKLYSKYKYGIGHNTNMTIDNTKKLDIIIGIRYLNTIIIYIKNYDNNIITYNVIKSQYLFDTSPFYKQILNNNDTQQLLVIYKHILENLLENFCLTID